MLRLRIPLAPSALRSAARAAAVGGAATPSPPARGAAATPPPPSPRIAAMEAVSWPAASCSVPLVSSGSGLKQTSLQSTFKSSSRVWLPRQGGLSMRAYCAVASAEVAAEPEQVPLKPILTPAQQALQPAKPPPAESGEIELDPEKLAEEMNTCSPLEIMDRALGMYGNDIAIAFGGAEDVALIEIAHQSARPYRVFTLDTGRMNPETYRFFTEVERHYNIQIEYVFPDAGEVEKLTKDKGMFSFYQDGHEECCNIRRIRPLSKKLQGLRSWITGQRRDQLPVSRGKLPVVQIDPSFDGRDGPETLLKWNPLASMSHNEIWRFLTNMNVPINELHTKGFASIGCEPCTRSILPWQHEREGRWWWEETNSKELGINKGNMNNVRPYRRQQEFGGDLYNNPSIIKFSREEMRALGKTTSREKSGVVCLYAPWCPHCQAMDAAYKELATRLEGTPVYIAKFRADGVNKMMCQQELMMTTFPTILFFPKNSTKFIKYPSERRDINSLHSFVMSFM
ncbi:5'-adenylylsulfate reductase 3, chloroplastic [Selaginella moellendorffii]|nr:5'-adenylylsulfate reductase 3, chloroplastic [Selaginella moellendorffii]|eukprot:XP_002994181.2 5'-adenylylsulfate reductase 3, chloroplastic [Selaginella moellendorffii]